MNNPKDNKQKVYFNTYKYVNNDNNRIEPDRSIAYAMTWRKTVDIIFIIFHRKRYYNSW